MNLFRGCLLAFLLCGRCFSSEYEDRPSLDAMAAHMIMVGFREAEIDGNSDISICISKGYVANVILFDVDMTANGAPRNIRSPEQLTRLVESLRKLSANALWIAVDQEGGAVQRLKPEQGFAKTYPTAKDLGEGDVALTYQTAKEIGAELKRYGFDLDFAPVADLDVDADSPAIGRKKRSFGDDPDGVARHALAYGTGLVDTGVIPCLKHFPGHGSARSDTHEGFTDISSTWSEEELLPYRTAFEYKWPGAVMTAHVYNRELDDALPASLSENITTGILRNRLGWDGVIITDDLHMGAIAKQYSVRDTVLLAVKAGADILVFSNNSRDLPYNPDLGREIHATLVGLVKDGSIPEERLHESWRRITTLKEKERPLRWPVMKKPWPSEKAEEKAG